MKINNIQCTQRNEIVVVNRKPVFQSKNILSQKVIDRLDLNMACAVNNPAPTHFEPAPECLRKKMLKFFHRMEIDWSTHVDPNIQKKRSY